MNEQTPTPDQTSAQAPRPKRRRLPRFLAWTAAVLVLLPVLAFGLVQMPLVQERLARFAESATAEVPGFALTLEGLSGFWPVTVRASRISLADENGVWLDARDLDIRFDPWRLFSGQVAFDHIRLSRLEVDRAPETGPAQTAAPAPEQAPASGSGFSLGMLPRLRLGEVSIPEIDLGEDLMGEAMRLAVRLEATTRSGAARLDASIDRLDAPGTTRLVAELSGPGPDLDLDLTIDEPSGGLWTGWFALTPEHYFSAKLSGKGPLSAWPGKLRAQAKDVWLFETDATLNAGLDLDKPLGVAAGGHYAMSDDALPAAALDILGRDIPFSVRGELADFTDLTIIDSNFGFGLGETTVKGTLKLDTSLATDATAHIVLADPMKLVEGSGLTLTGVTNLVGHVTGPVDRLDAAIEADVARAEIAGIAVRDAHLTAKAFLADLWERELSSLFLDCSMAATALDLPVPGLPAEPVRATLKVDTEGFERWQLNDIDLTSPLATATGQVEVGLDASLAGRVAARLPDLSRLAPAGGPALAALKGRADLDLTLTGAAGGERQSLRASGNIIDLTGLPGGLEGLFSGPLALSSEVVFTPGAIDLPALDLTAEGLRLSGSGRAALTSETFSAKAAAELEDSAPLGRLAATELSGPLSLTAAAAGGFADFGGELTLTSPHLGVQRASLDGLTVAATLSGLPGVPRAHIEAAAESEGRHLKLKGDVKLEAEQLTIKAAHFATKGLSANADAVVDLNRMLVAGHMKAVSRDLAPLGQLLDTPLGGSAEAEAELTVEGGQSVSLNARLQNLTAEGAKVASVRLDARVADVWGAPAGRIAAEVRSATLGQAEITRLKATARGGHDVYTLSTEAEGTFGRPFQAAAEASFAPQTDGWRLELTKLDGSWNDRPLSLETPAELVQGAEELSLSGLKLRLSDGRLSASGRTGPETSSWNAQLTELPLEVLRPFLGAPVSGVGRAQLTVDGPPASPRANIEAHVSDLSVAGGELESAPPVNIDLTAGASDGHVRMRASIGGLGASPLTATADLPVSMSLRPVRFEPNDAAPMSGALQGQIRLETLNALPSMDGRSMKGLAVFDLHAAGSLDDPDLSGTLRIENARFEDVASGLIVSHIAATVSAKDDRLSLAAFTAEDGDKGHLTAKGFLDLAPARSYPFELEARADKARLLRTSMATTVVDGPVAWKGSLASSTISGKLTLDPTEIEVPKRLPADIVNLPVTEINVAGEKGRVIRLKKPEPVLQQVNFDLELIVPARFFVRGRGLDAEFAGKIQIAGTAAAPILRGGLHTVRGRFNFLDRSFTLTEGAITFVGQTPPKPWLDVRAEASTADITARLHLTGPPDAFKIELDSTPPLPQDEILARLLFGRGTSGLNPIQALQLASALAELTGQSTGPDILGEVRKTLHLDRLDIQGGNNSSGASLSVGKYVSEDVYIGLDQNLQTGEQDVTVEVDLTPNVSLESRAGTASGAGIGVNWKYDY